MARAGREEAPRAQVGDLQLEASRAGVEDSLAVAIAVRGSRRRSLVRPGADLRGRFGFDEPLHRVFEDASQHVRARDSGQSRTAAISLGGSSETFSELEKPLCECRRS